MLNIVIPMAGRGSRFAEAGYSLPKPLIPVHGIPMIQLVIDNLRPKCPHRFIFLCLEEHLENHGLNELLQGWAPGCLTLTVHGVTEGAACTVLLAKDQIDNTDQLMIANCDQWIDIDINKYLAQISKDKLDGLIMTMWANDPKWSFVRFDSSGQICEVVEKQVVSNEATVGIYNYRQGSDFVKAAEQMIANNLRVNNEFYVAPAYNEMIANSQKIGIYNTGRELQGMYGLGVPQDLEAFIGLPISRQAIASIMV